MDLHKTESINYNHYLSEIAMEIKRILDVATADSDSIRRIIVSVNVQSLAAHQEDKDSLLMRSDPLAINKTYIEVVANVKMNNFQLMQYLSCELQAGGVALYKSLGLHHFHGANRNRKHRNKYNCVRCGT